MLVRDQTTILTLFNIDEKKKRHEEVFPKECEKAFELGAEMLQIYNINIVIKKLLTRCQKYDTLKLTLCQFLIGV